MKVRARVQAAITANPLAWLLFAALLFAVYGNWKLGTKLTRVCELTGPHDVFVRNPRTPRQELENICIEREAEPDTGIEMFETLAKAVDLLKASFWQAAMIAVACGGLLYLSITDLIPGMENLVPLLWIATFIAAALAVAAFLSDLEQRVRRWGAVWERHRARKNAAREFRSYLPFLSDKERQILGYIREKKLKTFEAAMDGGYANGLLARRFIVQIAAPGQVFNEQSATMAVPDFVWAILQEQPDHFPYKPEYSGGRDSVETQPWRKPWGVY